MKPHVTPAGELLPADEVKLEKSVTANMHIPQIHAADRFAIQ
jgi:hypothetical protein